MWIETIVKIITFSLIIFFIQGCSTKNTITNGEKTENAKLNLRPEVEQKIPEYVESRGDKLSKIMNRDFNKLLHSVFRHCGHDSNLTREELFNNQELFTCVLDQLLHATKWYNIRNQLGKTVGPKDGSQLKTKHEQFVVCTITYIVDQPEPDWVTSILCFKSKDINE